MTRFAPLALVPAFGGILSQAPWALALVVALGLLAAYVGLYPWWTKRIARADGEVLVIKAQARARAAAARRVIEHDASPPPL